MVKPVQIEHFQYNNLKNYEPRWRYHMRQFNAVPQHLLSISNNAWDYSITCTYQSAGNWYATTKMTDTVLLTAIIDLLYPLRNTTESIFYQHDTKLSIYTWWSALCMVFESSNPRWSVV
jgi:hypothetical protein